VTEPGHCIDVISIQSQHFREYLIIHYPQLVFCDEILVVRPRMKKELLNRNAGAKQPFPFYE
jgi:hypothetical protein